MAIETTVMTVTRQGRTEQPSALSPEEKRPEKAGGDAVRRGRGPAFNRRLTLRVSHICITSLFRTQLNAHHIF